MFVEWLPCDGGRKIRFPHACSVRDRDPCLADFYKFIPFLSHIIIHLFSKQKHSSLYLSQK